MTVTLESQGSHTGSHGWSQAVPSRPVPSRPKYLWLRCAALRKTVTRELPRSAAQR
jgi:hypothetical protein